MQFEHVCQMLGFSWYYDFSLKHQIYFPIFWTNSLNILYAFSNIPIKMASARTGSESRMTHIHSVSARKAGRTHTSHACEWLREISALSMLLYFVVQVETFPRRQNNLFWAFLQHTCLSVSPFVCPVTKIAKYTTLRTKHLFQCRYVFKLASIQMLHVQVRMDNASHFLLTSRFYVKVYKSVLGIMLILFEYWLRKWCENLFCSICAFVVSTLVGAEF